MHFYDYQTKAINLHKSRTINIIKTYLNLTHYIKINPKFHNAMQPSSSLQHRPPTTCKSCSTA